MKNMSPIQTKSVLIQTLCVPCRNRCRYCLLSWDGQTVGAAWERSVSLAERLIGELKEARPGVNVSFSFGYSMEHPDLRNAIRTLKRLGSPTAKFLQCDGMAMRDEKQCRDLMEMLKDEGVKTLSFTVYGSEKYHDRFAGRRGDFALLLRMMRAASASGISFSTRIPITKENINDANELIPLLKNVGNEKVSLFIPHAEGRGKNLEPIRLQAQDLSALSPENREVLNTKIYRTEAEWLSAPSPAQTSRAILISLRADNIENYESRDAFSVVEEIEGLDEAYYAAFPSFEELARDYGDPEGQCLYSFRDLWHRYRMRYAAEHDLKIYDVTDERQSGSRRYE